MQVEKDLRNAIELIKGYNVDKREYRSVKIFSDFSLKHFKKYKLDGKKTMLKLRSYDEVADMLSYGANITCYSTNRFDEYFLNLFLESLKLNYKEHFNFFISDYGLERKTFCYEIYKIIRGNLSDDVQYFFDELYKKFTGRQILNSKLLETTDYTYNELMMYIRYFINSKYYKVCEQLNERKVEFIHMNDNEASTMFKDESFDFINLSYRLDTANEKEREQLIKKVNEFSRMLKENGKVQGFVSRNSEIIIPDAKRIETRSFIDPYTNNNECKKDYAYMYTKNK